VADGLWLVATDSLPAVGVWVVEKLPMMFVPANNAKGVVNANALRSFVQRAPRSTSRCKSSATSHQLPAISYQPSAKTKKPRWRCFSIEALLK
jgi:hypothetical protein